MFTNICTANKLVLVRFSNRIVYVPVVRHRFVYAALPAVAAAERINPAAMHSKRPKQRYCRNTKHQHNNHYTQQHKKNNQLDGSFTFAAKSAYIILALIGGFLCENVSGTINTLACMQLRSGKLSVGTKLMATAAPFQFVRGAARVFGG